MSCESEAINNFSEKIEPKARFKYTKHTKRERCGCIFHPQIFQMTADFQSLDLRYSESAFGLTQKKRPIGNGNR